MIAAIVLAGALDLGSSCYAFSTGRFEEANPMLPFVGRSCARLALVVGAAATTVVLTHRKLRERHPKIAKYVGLSFVVTRTGLAVYNTIQIGRSR